MTKLFITGATGYIGGDALYALSHAHPELEITAIVRSSEKGAKIAAQYPKIRLVYGDLDNTDLLTEEASNADIVVHTAHADHVGAATALVAGLAKRGDKPGFIIHTSGTGSLAFADAISKRFGQPPEKEFDDYDNLGDLLGLPPHTIHFNVDKIIQDAGNQNPKISSAIVAPSIIYGPGRGPDNQKSIQIYQLAKTTLQRKKAVYVDEGKNVWNTIHVQDLSNVYLRLVEEAIKGGGSATWGKEAFYIAENGTVVWLEVAKATAQAAFDKGLIPSPDVESITADEADKLTPWGAFLWGTSSLAKAIRARKVLGWTPTQKSVVELLPDIVEVEAKELGLVKGHAAEASG